MATAGVRDELNCSVCREIYTDPVTLPCGHNYCRDCIERTWEGEMKNFGDNPSCPECRRRYGKRPELNKNMTLCNIAERFHVTDPQHGWTGIFCTYCDSPVAAAKSCLLCEASLCDYHLEKHSKSPEHVLTEPTTSFEERKCSTHRKMLEFYCTEDGACICSFCSLVGDHGGHKVKLLSEASEKKKEKLKKVLEKLRPEREETDGQIQNLEKCRREVAEKAAGETERVTVLFRDIREQLEALEKQVLGDISREQEKVSLKLQDLIQQLEIKKAKLSRKIRHIEELCNMADPLTVLQARESETSEQCNDTNGGDNMDRMKYLLSRDEGNAYVKDTDKQEERDTIKALYVDQISEALVTGLADIEIWVTYMFHGVGFRDISMDCTAPAKNISLFLHPGELNEMTTSSESNHSTHEYWDMVGCYSGGGQ